MKTNKPIAAAAVALGSLVALAGWAKSEKYVQIFVNGYMNEYKASDIDYIEVIDRLIEPDAPAEMTATLKDGKVYLQWSEVSDVRYNLYRSPDGLNYTYTLLAENLQGNTYIDDAPLAGFNCYLVKSVDEGLESHPGAAAVISAEESDILVGTLCGYKYDSDTQGEVFGPFDTTSGFRYEGCMTFDPLYPDRLYVVYDGFYGGGNQIVQLDLKERTHTLLMSASKFQDRRLRNCSFTPDGQYMLVATDRDDIGWHSNSLWIVKRSSDGTFSDRLITSVLAAYKQCNSVAVHPVNGEVYFSSYANGEILRLDPEKYFSAVNGEEDWTGYFEDGCFDKLFRIADPSLELSITIHPTGNYAYLNGVNRHCIYRTDYDWENKTFTTPYVVAGEYNHPSYADGATGESLMNNPYQGVFVKNPEYAGKADEYDYYFTDKVNFCVRALTPEGNVSTLAGRIPNGDGNLWGTEDGDGNVARFRDITGLAYDERTETFYVLDNQNRRIRTIRKK